VNSNYIDRLLSKAVDPLLHSEANPDAKFVMDMLSQFDSNKTTAFQTMEEERQERVKSELYKEAINRGMDQRLM